ncbi:MAG: MerR family transcriptional regulator [Parvibaculales bacterium]
MTKSEAAFRTISEVAALMQVEPHVLRFWETKFRQIQPIKKARGRRLYRPEDVSLITNIKRLLHDEGMTIKGVQKVLREQGVDVFRKGEVTIAASETIGAGKMSDRAQGPALGDLRAKLYKIRAGLSEAAKAPPQQED